jgi:hypothetical protein
MLAVLVAASVTSGAVGIGPLTPVFHQPISISANGGVIGVGLQPIPEGPMPNGGGPTVAQLEPFIPNPLPAPLNQWFCGIGGDLVVFLGNGGQVIYGPCYRPASIDHLWAEIIYIESNGQCAPRCGPGGAAGP